MEARVDAPASSGERRQIRRRWLRPPLWVSEQYGPKTQRELTLSERRNSFDAPSIAIVTPTLNRRQYLQATIDSVLMQAYPRLNYCVQDGASTDGTVDLLRSYDSRLLWRSEHDSGQA